MPWTDPGATATDAEDGTLPITVGGDTVDTATVGTYNVTYSATDSGGLTTTETRQVNVISANTAPAITLLGANPDTVTIAGATHKRVWALEVETRANDDIVYLNHFALYTTSGVLIPLSQIETNSTTFNNLNNIFDADTNTGGDLHAPNNATRLYMVQNTEVDASYFELANGLNGPSGFRLYYRDVPVADDPNTYSYTVNERTYNSGLVDSLLQGVQTFNLETLPPAPNLGIPTYTDPGATASDLEDGDITANIIVTGSVDLATIGQYTLNYDVNDSQGLPAPTVIRTVNVVASFALKAVEATNNIAAMLDEQYVNDPSVIAAMAALLPIPNTGEMQIQAPSYNGGIATAIGTTLPHNISLATFYTVSNGTPDVVESLGQLTIADFSLCSSYTAASGIFSAWTLGQQVKIIDEDYHVLLINDNNGTAIPGACALDASPSTNDYTSDINGGIYLGYVDPVTRVISGIQEITTAPFTNQVGLQVFLSKDATPANLATVVTLA